MTSRLKGRADVWRQTGRLTDERLCELLREDGGDIVVETCGHIEGNRMAALSRKPVPVQLSYMYPHSTGMAAIDGRLTDGWADPVGHAERFYVEKVVRLPAPVGAACRRRRRRR